MRGSSGTVALAAAMIALAAWPGAAGAAPVKGAYYVGHAPGISGPLHLRVSADGRRLTNYLFATKIPCSDGERREFALNEIREKRFGITTDGRFDFRSVNRFTHRGGKRPIRGTDTLRIVGSFTGDRALLRIENNFRGRTNCTAVTPITFTRVGSPALPSSDGVMTTGRYRVSNPIGNPVQVTPFRTIGPARLIEKGFTLTWDEVYCTRGFRFRDAYATGPLLVSPRGKVRVSIRDRFPVRGGYRVRRRARLVLDFSKLDPGWVANGSWSATSKLYRRGRHVSTCSRPPARFQMLAQ